jgi:hypothetical protein
VRKLKEGSLHKTVVNRTQKSIQPVKLLGSFYESGKKKTFNENRDRKNMTEALYYFPKLT